MSKYLELFKGSFNDSINEKTKPENKPYIGYSLTEGKLAYTVVPKEEPSLYEAVDLGLPSGLKWANMNVGATSPEDAGLYFQWGDTVGYTKEQVEAGEKVFDWSTYFDTNDGGSTFNKYAVDKLTVLESEDDAATAHMGSEWRMPTYEEIRELLDNTTPTFIDLRGNKYSKEQVEAGDLMTGDGFNLKGVKLTGSNNNSIFIPSGYLYSGGSVWSSSLESWPTPDGEYSVLSYCLSFGLLGGPSSSSTERCKGLSARGVQA